MAILRVTWVKDGNVNWEGWWIKRHGYVRTRLPGEQEHVSFANFDLKSNGLPRLIANDDGNYSIDVIERDYPNVKYFLENHGFLIAPYPS